MLVIGGKIHCSWRKATVSRRIATLCLLLSSLSMVAVKPASANGFRVQSAETVLVNNVYLLNANLDFEFTKQVLEAIENGVPLVLVLDIELLRPRDYIWDEQIASLKQRYQLQFHALTEQYIVRNLNSNAQYSFSTLTAALNKLGLIENLPIIDEKLLKSKHKYLVRIRARLELDALPVPLRLTAYFSKDWWLISDWYALGL